jgi:hypothetical protein
MYIRGGGTYRGGFLWRRLAYHSLGEWHWYGGVVPTGDTRRVRLMEGEIHVIVPNAPCIWVEANDPENLRSLNIRMAS